MGRPSKVTVVEFSALEAVSHFVNKNRSTTLEVIVVSLESRVKDLTPENRGVFVSKIAEAIGTLEESGKILETDSGITFVPNPKGRPKGSKNTPKATPEVVPEVVSETAQS